MMKTILNAACAVILFAWGVQGVEAIVPNQTEAEIEAEPQNEREGHTLYIDGQEQTYAGEPIFHQGMLYVTVPGAVKVLNEKAELDPDVPYANALSLYDYLKDKDLIKKVDGREAVRIIDLQDLGIRALWYDNPGRLHLETVEMLTVDDLEIGDDIETVKNKVDAHWNTGYGLPADYIGFVGDMKEFTYTDRFGEEHIGEVPELQLEITDGLLTYIIISDTSYKTAKGITVGDKLFDVTSTYGSDYLKETIDGKLVYIYHVRDGSIWFIANEKSRRIERIGIWNSQLEGFER